MKIPNSSYLVKRSWFICVAGTLLLALVLRAWGLNAESIWIDEAFSIVLAQHSPFEIIQGTAADQHPPLYYLLLHFWFWLGDSIAFARWLSVLIGLIGVYQAIIFGKYIGGYSLGLLSGLFVATSPMHIWYSTEVRMYILLCSLTTASTYYLRRNLREEHKMGWFYYGVFILLSQYTHYFNVFVLIAQGIWVLIASAQNRQTHHLIRWMLSTTIAGIFFLPWLPIAIFQFQAHSLEWLSSPTLTEARDIFLKLFFGTKIYALPDWGRIILLILTIGSVTIAFIRIKENGRMNYIFFGWISIFPFILTVALSIYYPVFQFKQFVIILIPLLIWLGLTIRNLPRHWRVSALGLILLFTTATNVNQMVSITKDDWKSATEFIQSHIEPNDIIFGNPAAISLATSIYEQKVLSPIGYPTDYDIITGGWEGEIITGDIAKDLMLQATNSKHRLWLVEFYPNFWDPNSELEKWLTQNGKIIDDYYFDNIRVRLYLLNR